MAKSTCKQKLILIIPSACILIAGVFIILSTITLPAVLKSSVQDQIKLGPDTYQYWGQSPGMTKSKTLRNFTFFNFSNPREFLYQNKQPVFNAINGFMLQQRFNYTNYKYTDDMSEVFYNDWLFFTPVQGSKDLDTKLNVLNVGPLGFWYQLDLVGMPTFALQGFGGLFVQLNQTFKTQAIGQGVNSQFLANYTNWKPVCDTLQISIDQCNNTWFDPQYGLNDQNNYQIWIDFAYNNNQAAQNYLKTYFGFNDYQMGSLQQVFKEWAETLNQILQNWFCDGKSCSSNYLTLLQISSGNVTANPPSGDAVDSICDTGNVTCIGQPEISKYLKNQFKKKYNQSKYQQLKFSTQTFSYLFRPYTGTLLNIGNLTDLFEVGYKFDNSQTIKQRDILLEQIRKQTHAQTKDHAFVIWEWVKYFASQFVIKFSKGGSQKNSGIGGVFSQAFYQSFSNFADYIIEEYMNVLGQQQIKDCQEFVKQTISQISTEKVQLICSPIKTKKGRYYNLFEPCFGSIQGKERYRMKNNLRLSEFGQYCDVQQKSFYTVALGIHQKIFNKYDCNKNKGVKICSGYQLAMKQFINSTVTLNPIQNSIKTYPKSLSCKDWNTNLDWFQYKNYLKQAYGNQSLDNQQFQSNQLIDTLSFDKLFSASMIMQLMIQNNQTNFQKLYYWKNMTLLKNFIKFITIQVGFGGFTQQRSPKQLLFGYNDPFLEGLKQTDTMMGGDPSINPIIMLNQPNITEKQAQLFPQSIYTGYSDISKTRQYSTIWGFNYLTYNKTWYDGYNIKSQFVSPYKSHVPIKGTDSMQSPPSLDQKSCIYCLITNIYRTAKLCYTEHTQLYDVDLLKFNVDKSFLQNQWENSQNSVYYQPFEGFHNVTFLGVPLHISKNNFYSCPKNWSQLITVYDEKGQYLIKPSQENDDTVLKVEPNTGALFYGSVRLQTSYHFQSDVLFGPGDRMLPVTNVIRQGQIQQEIVDELFGDLKMALTLSKVLLILATIMIPLSMGVIVWRCYKQGAQRRQNNEIQKSLIEKESLITESNTIIQTTKQLKSQEQKQKKEQAHQQVKVQQNNNRIQQIETIIIQKSEQNKRQQSMSVFPNINQTIVDQ